MVRKSTTLSRSSLRRAGLPCAVFVAGVLASLWLWGELRGAQRDQLSLIVGSAAEETAHAVGAVFDAQKIAVGQLAELWARFPLQSDEAWVAHATTLVDHLPEFERLLWIDLRGDAVWIAQPAEGADRLGRREREVLAPLLGTARDAASQLVLGPEQEPGGPRYHVVAPASVDGAKRGVLIATARLQTSLAPTARPLLGRFRTQLVWQGLEVLNVGEDAVEGPMQSAHLEVPGAGSIEIRASPAPRLVNAVVDGAPAYVLAAGIVASALLAGLSFAYRVLHDRSVEVALAHRETEEEAARAKDAERDAFRLATELEDRVAARTQQLAEAVEQLEAFNYSVSHDLRSPLGAIINFSAILADEHGPALGAEGADLISRIGRSAHTAVAMMDGLLELSRLGRTPLSLQRVDMEALARETMEQVRSASGAPAVRFDLGALPPALGDPALLRLVLSNLLHNALKYTQAREKPFIAASGYRAGGETFYAVRDDGVGFDMRYAGKLFRPFQRLHGSSDFPGSGIGLAIVARAVRRHGGRVWAEGQPGRGATFWFALPTEHQSGAGAP